MYLLLAIVAATVVFAAGLHWFSGLEQGARWASPGGFRPARVANRILWTGATPAGPAETVRRACDVWLLLNGVTPRPAVGSEGDRPGAPRRTRQKEATRKI